MEDARIQALDEFLIYLVQSKEHFQNELRQLILSKARVVVERQDLLDFVISRDEVWQAKRASDMGICLYTGQCPYHNLWNAQCWNRNILSARAQYSYEVLWIHDGYNGFR